MDENNELRELIEAYKINKTGGDYENALKYAKCILEIEKEKLPPNHPDIADSHNNIGALYYFVGQYDKALKYLRFALKIREKVLPPNHPNIADSHNNIGALYRDMGQYDGALKHHRLALEIMEKALPPNHPNIADSHNNIGIVYYDMGQYDGALKHHLLALKIREKVLPPGHPDIATLHGNIGIVYYYMGQYDGALKHHLLALKIREKALPPGHPDIAASHGNIGVFYHDMRQYDGALKHHRLALKIMEKALPPGHPDIATLHSNIGIVYYYMHMGQYDGALKHHLLALKIREKALPPGHPNIADSHNNIGIVYYDMGQYEEALEHHRLAMEIRERVLPPGHPDIAYSHSNIGWVYHDMGQYSEYANKLLTLLPPMYLNAMPIANEAIRTNRLRSLNSHIYFIHTISWTNLNKICEKTLYDLLLKSKDIGAESEYVIRATEIPEHHPKDKDTLVKLKDKRAYYQYLVLNRPTESEKIKELSEEIQALELSLSYIKEIDFKLHMEAMNTDKVFEKLPSGHALIEYGWFRYTKSAADTRTDIESGGRYYAYVLRDGKITLHYLKTKDEYIHKKIYEAREKITKTTKTGVPIPQDASKELSELYALLIGPFEKELCGVKHLYIAPDGDLLKLPFEVLLRNEKGETLSDEHRTVSYLSSGRNLVRPESQGKPISGYTSAAILADPLYELPKNDEELRKLEETYSKENDMDEPKIENNDNTYNKRGMTSRQSRDSKNLSFEQLPFAKVEADAFDRAFAGTKTKLYNVGAKKDSLGETASRDRSPNIVHIVTHGFAHEIKELPEDKRERLFSDRVPHQYAEDPLIRCGLAFAGVNNGVRKEEREALEKYGDGILNAKEVLALDLPTTDLLVLSACETGLGETRNGEGIQGLRKAFELVGVRTLICTLWSVSDAASAILIGKFYENLLKKGMDKIEALSKAKTYVKEMSHDEVVQYKRKNNIEGGMRGARPYQHPYYWAGYVLQGEIERPGAK